MPAGLGIAAGSIAGGGAVFVVTKDGLHGLDAGGRRLPGFPALAGRKLVTTPALADLTPDAGEPETEILIADNSGALHAVSARGRTADGWPASIEGSIGPWVAVDRLRTSHSRGTVALRGKKDVFLVDHSALVRQGRWPVRLEMATGGIALADLDGDGTVEVIVTTARGFDVLAEHGASLRQFSVAAGGAKLGSPVVDVGLAARESVGGAAVWVADNSGQIHRIGASGEYFAGWPVRPGGKPTELALADFDGDGLAEAVFGDDQGRLHLLDDDGSAAPGWPVDLGSPVASAPAIADLDGTGQAVVLVSTADGFLHAIDIAGRELAGWPVDAGRPLSGGPTITDLDGNSRADIVGVTADGRALAWELGEGSYNPRSSPWPTGRGDSGRTGRWPRSAR